MMATNTKCEIRPAMDSDSAGIARVQITSYRAAYAPFFPQAYLDHFTLAEQTSDWHELLSVRQSDPVFIAHNSQREIVGYALGRNQAAEFSGLDGELVALHVLPGEQRQGIGRRLSAALARELKRRGAASLMLWTLKENSVRAWYERLGGALVGEKSYDVDEATITEVAYGWQDIESLIEQLDPRRNGA